MDIVANILNYKPRDNLCIASNACIASNTSIKSNTSIRSYEPTNTIIGFHSDNEGEYNTIIGPENFVNGNNNIVVGNNNLITGNNNFIFGSNIEVTGDNNMIFGNIMIINGNNHYIVLSNNIFKDIMFDKPLIYKLMIFNDIDIPKDIIRHIINIIYELRLTKGEAMMYCSNIVSNSLRLGFSNFRSHNTYFPGFNNNYT
jgi:hypothetical protein